MKIEGIDLPYEGVFKVSDEDTAQDNDGYFGLCPVKACNQQLQIRNVSRNHYMCCHEHKMFWPLGSNLFSGWHDENERIWGENALLLSDYTEVHPYHREA